MSRDALVVGINTYRYLQALQSPAQDAEAIAQVLQTYGEFRVQRFPEVVQSERPYIGKTTPVSLQALETALVNLFKPKGHNIPQTALFYFSGHGIQKDAGIQEGYLAISDTQPASGFYGLSLFWLRRLLQESPVRQRIVILDCCHSGELLNFLEADPGAKAGTDRLFIAASREYESAYESLDSPYSVLTQAVREGLDPRYASSGRVTSHYLTAWVSNRLKGEIQQPLFENSGNEIVLTRCSETDSLSPVAVSTASDVCPFRGLEFFDEAHADCFFGREELTQQLVDAVATNSFTTVLGASGSGKSSLVRAGLVRELKRGQVLPGSDRWQIKLITPTEHPLRSLASVFVDSDLPELVRAEQLRRAETFLQDKENGLEQLVCTSLPSATGWPSTAGTGRAAPRLVLIIDQFEEVFSLCGGAQGEQERRHFFDCLTLALKKTSDRFRIVVVLRSDFLGQCLAYPSLAAHINRKIVRVVPMGYEQIKTTIVQPAKKAGLVCEPNLVYTMLLDVIGAPGELPLLQYTLTELWHHREIDPTGGPSRLTLNAYTHLGGVRGTLQKQAAKIFDQLTPEEQTVTRRIFLALTQLGEGTEDTRRRITKAELVSPTFSQELVEQTLEKLVAAKLVITSRGGDGVKADKTNALPLGSKLDIPLPNLDLAHRDAPSRDVADVVDVVDVVHESLIRNWPLLRSWLDESRDMLRRQRRIEHAAQEWAAINQSQKRLQSQPKRQSKSQIRAADYLLRGERLLNAERFLRMYPQELSAQGRVFVAASMTQRQRLRRKLRLLQVTVPSAMAIALLASFNQYRDVVKTQSEKNYQAQVATSRERAAIAQSILQEPSHDSMAALLISRLAAEHGERTYEAQSSLRAALRDLRLQVQLDGHHASVNQIAFSPDAQFMATSSADGTIRLWTGSSRAIYAQQRDQAQRVLSWQSESNSTLEIAPSEGSQPSVPNFSATSPSSGSTSVSAPPSSTSMSSNIIAMTFSPDGKRIAAIAHQAMQVKIWSVESGELVQQLALPQPATQISFSADGRWIAARGDRTVSLWQAKTGKLQARLTQDWNLHSFQFSPNSKSLLLVGQSGNLQLWQLTKQLGQITPYGQKTSGSLASVTSASTPNTVSASSPVVTANPTSVPVDNSGLGLVSVRSGDVSALEMNQDELEPSINLQQIYDLKQSSDVTQAVFSPSGRWIATASKDGVASLWDAVTGKLHYRFVQQVSSNSSSAVPYIPTTATVASAVSSISTAVPVATVVQPPSSESGALPSASPQPITRLAFSPDETVLAIGTIASRARLWNIQTKQLQAELVQDEAIAPDASSDWGAITFSPNGRQIIISRANTVEVWDAQTGRRLTTLQSEGSGFTTAQFSPDGTYIATGGSNGDVRLWAAEAGGELPTLSVPNATTSWISFFDAASSGNKAVEQRQSWPREDSAVPSGASALLSIARPKQPTPPLPNVQLVERSALTTDGLVMVASDGTVKNWNILADRRSLPTATPTATQPDPAQPNPLHPDMDSTLVHLNRFAPQRIWQQVQQLFHPSNPEQPPIAERSAPSSLAPITPELPDPELPDSELSNPELSANLERPTEATSSGLGLTGSDPLPAVMSKLTADTLLTGFSLSPNGQFTATATSKGWVEIRQNQPGERSIRLRQFRNDALNPEGDRIVGAAPVLLQQLAFSPDNRYLLGVGADLTVRLWYVQSGQAVGILSGHKAAIQRAQFSPDGQRVVTASLDGTATVWEVATQRKLVVLPHTTGVTSANFSPDGQWIVTTTEDGTVRIVEATTGTPHLVLGGHRGAVMDAQFSPDGRSLVTAGTDGTARLWDTQTGTEQTLLRPNPIEPVAFQRAFFSPDGQYVATLTADGQVYLWAATWEMLLKLARDRSLRQLTPDECGRYLRLESYTCPQLMLQGRSQLSQQFLSGL